MFKALVSKHEEDKSLLEEDSSVSGSLTPPSPLSDAEEKGNEIRLRRTDNEMPIPLVSSSSSSESKKVHFTSAEALTAHAISTDLSKHPSLDPKSQDEIITKYRELDKKLEAEGLYQCPYSSYAIDVLRYTILFTLFWKFLHNSHYALSGLFLGLFWHQLVFTAHDAGHMGMTHSFQIDTCIGIFIADFLGGLSLGWWKRNHNVHHIVTNSPEHDPDIEHMPFFAISHRFFSSLYSSYYDREMKFDAASQFFSGISSASIIPFFCSEDSICTY
ncbi:hypothetical protein OCU04_009125 [Sclerotinia nivalis]|uniref:Fatty acid desaturase domain-containing protein n=1 Tax=Sclerotinia nivalis TaxID=352851 RepID=A0A9X0AGV8_9HELO|nr:hypothetical protein OCU04_009125 [Sclerotinia nivalis]